MRTVDDSLTSLDRPWNAGRIVGPKKALKPKEVWAIRFDLQHRGLTRDRALFDIAIDSKLRGCALVRLRIGDVSAGGAPRAKTRSIMDLIIHH